MGGRIDAILAGYDHWNRADYDQVQRGYHDDAQFEPGSESDIFAAAMFGGENEPGVVYRGHSPEWSDFRIEPQGAAELDADHYLVEVVVRGRGARSGLEVSDRYWHLYEYRGPKVAKARSFHSRDEALAAYREEAPTGIEPV